MLETEGANRQVNQGPQPQKIAFPYLRSAATVAGTYVLEADNKGYFLDLPFAKIRCYTVHAYLGFKCLVCKMRVRSLHRDLLGHFWALSQVLWPTEQREIQSLFTNGDVLRVIEAVRYSA